MNEITDILSVFLNIFRNDIIEYFQKTYSYLKDLVVYKKIDLNKKIETENEIQVKKTFENILKAIKTGLNTIGISIEKLNEDQKTFIKYLNKDKARIDDYNSFFEENMQNYVNILLIEILIDYLLNKDEKKLENVNLFDLLPPYFISKLNEFKRSHFNTKDNIELFKQQNYKNYINFKDLTIIKSRKESGDNILNQLREAKEGFMETLKTPKREVLKQSIGSMKKSIKLEEKITQNKISKPMYLKEQESKILLKTNTFLDSYGNSMPISSEIINRFDVDKLSLVNLIVVNREYFDLESLFYYVSILKMLNLKLPFSQEDIQKLLKNYVNKWVFSSSIDNIPDSINNFYGLAVFSELDLLNKTKIIDLQEIEDFIISDLDEGIPEKLDLNLHSLLCIKLIIKMRKKYFERKLNLESISNLNVAETVSFNPILDIFNHLSVLKLLGKEESINSLKIAYAYEIKKLMTSNNSINDLITESARTLLIIDLLNLKENESKLCNNLLNFIWTKTSFFNTQNLHPKFNWRSDELAFKVELEMLYWALLASTVYGASNI
ncbi:MAG: hypothetical protein ACFFDF_14345 [Candidatus Odinarchaeota archaeon]